MLSVGEFKPDVFFNRFSGDQTLDLITGCLIVLVNEILYKFIAAGV